MKSLVIVLGAGASKEVGLPIGTELKSEIARLLDIRFPGDKRQQGGDELLAEAYRVLVAHEKDRNGQFEQFVSMGWRIRDAMPQAISIDNFIDCHANEPKIAVCGKLAIARAILSAEAKSTLAVNEKQAHCQMDFARYSSTWFNGFFQLLTEHCSIEALADRLREVVIVSFNYDRCLEHYLFNAIQNYYGVRPDKAAELIDNLEIYHPFGKVGSLPWIGGDNTIGFGSEVDVDQFILVSQQIRTFTEGTDPSNSNIKLIRATINSARRIVFLGFAFHRLNMELLFDTAGSTTKETQIIFGSALGISPSDCSIIRSELSSKTGLSNELVELRNDATCAKLVQEYWRSLSLV